MGGTVHGKVSLSMHFDYLAGERIGKMVRNAEKAKTPVMCVVGDKERSSGNIIAATLTWPLSLASLNYLPDYPIYTTFIGLSKRDSRNCQRDLAGPMGTGLTGRQIQQCRTASVAFESGCMIGKKRWPQKFANQR